MWYVIEVPTNANTIFAGRVIHSTKNKYAANRRADNLTRQECLRVDTRQDLANEIAGDGVAATEIPASQFIIIPEAEWDMEFERRRKQR